MKSIALVLALALPSTAAFAGEWQHRVRTSVDGATINLDYIHDYSAGSDYKPTNVDSAGPTYINLSGTQFTGNEKVTAVLNNFENPDCTPFGRGNSVPYTYIFDLRWENGHFSGVTSSGRLVRSYMDMTYDVARPMWIRTTGYGGLHCYSQTISIVVDGRWLVDPVSRSNDFGVNMFAE